MTCACPYAAIAILLLSGCGQHVSGVVRDAASDRPVANASVELGDTGWGSRDGQLVWDAEKTAHTLTDANGRFGFNEGGGVRLRVLASGHGEVETSLCARSPMVVRVGGPYPELRANRRIFLDENRLSSPHATSIKDFGLTASGTALDGDFGLKLEAKGGIRFVEGTGTIPPPPPLPYEHAVDLDLRSACGWLFVSDGTSAVAVIQAGAIGSEQDPGGPRRPLMLYTPLPKQ